MLGAIAYAQALGIAVAGRVRMQSGPGQLAPYAQALGIAVAGRVRIQSGPGQLTPKPPKRGLQ